MKTAVGCLLHVSLTAGVAFAVDVADPGSPVTATTGRAKGLLGEGSIAPHPVRSVLVAGLLCLAIGGGLVWAASAGYFAP